MRLSGGAVGELLTDGTPIFTRVMGGLISIFLLRRDRSAVLSCGAGRIHAAVFDAC
jgi:hypothetical protein